MVGLGAVVQRDPGGSFQGVLPLDLHTVEMLVGTGAP